MLKNFTYQRPPLENWSMNGIFFIAFSWWIWHIFIGADSVWNQIVFTIGGLPVVTLLFLEEFSKNKKFHAVIKSKKLSTGTHGRFGTRTFYYNLILDSGIKLYVPFRVYAMLEAGDTVQGSYRLVSKRVQQLSASIPESREYEQRSSQLESQKTDMAWSKRRRTLVLVFLVVVLMFLVHTASR